MSAFLLILVLELGDTTMLLTIGFVLTMPNALVVAVAAGLALTLVALSACLIGPRVGARVEPKHLDRVVVIVLMIVGAVTIVYAVEPGWLPALG
jgi:putative Ca2+/H+ antiporter (TMEM165/GDT1 family)